MWSIFTILLVTANALPPQTILVDDLLALETTMPFKYDTNASWITTCPDGQKVTCPHEGGTCCHMKDEQWGCCPFSDGQCCRDKLTCCPKDFKCDLHRHVCIKDKVCIFSYIKRDKILFDRINFTLLLKELDKIS